MGLGHPQIILTLPDLVCGTKTIFPAPIGSGAVFWADRVSGRDRGDAHCSGGMLEHDVSMWDRLQGSFFKVTFPLTIFGIYKHQTYEHKTKPTKNT